MTPDANVLVAASRQDHPHHLVALDWLTGAMLGARQRSDLSLLGTVVASFLRLVTHPKIFTMPTPTQQAVEFIDSLLSSTGVTMLAAGSEWPQLRSLCLAKNLSANALPDGWIAACVLQHQEVLATFDRDFVKLLPNKNLQLLLPTS